MADTHTDTDCDCEACSLDAELQDMPTAEWWVESRQSFQMLQQLIRPEWMAKKFQEEYEQSVIDETSVIPENAINQRMASEHTLPFINVLAAGSHRLGLTATNEPLECIAFGTMGAQRFIELFWEAVVQVQQTDSTVVVHEVQSSVPRIWLTVGLHEFELKYVHCENLIRSFPCIVNAPSFFLDDQHNCNQNVRNVVNDLKRDSELVVGNRRRAFHYIRAWGIAKGLYKTRFTAQDFVRICPPAPETTPHAWDTIDEDVPEHSATRPCSCTECTDSSEFRPTIAQFLSNMGVHMDAAIDTTLEAEWKQFLLATEKEPFYAKMREEFPYYIAVALVFGGTSMVQGQAWLSMVDRKVVQLKERLEARLTKPDIQIWPQRLVRPNADPDDDPYEGYIMIGLRCPETDRPLTDDIVGRWQTQVLEDTTLKSECFMYFTVYDRKSLVAEKEDLKPTDKIWPKPEVKPEADRSKRESDSEDQGGQSWRRDLRRGLPSNSGSKSLKSSDSPSTSSKRPDHPSNCSKEQNDSDTKGPRMRTAGDVLKRLQHDRALKIDDYIVGYMDRHGGIKEKPARKWEKESTHEEFIPQSRIEYFRKGGEIIWDRASKTDKMFMSGNSAPK